MNHESDDDDPERDTDNDEPAPKATHIDDDDDDDDYDEKKEPVVDEVEEEEEVDPRNLLSKEQIKQFKNLFDSFDVNKKEKIPTKTIGFVLRLMGLNPTKEDIKKHMAEIDPGNKGVIDFVSFLLPIAQRINQEPETHEDIIAAFRIFDEDQSDIVYTDQVVEYLTTLGEDLEDFEIESLLKMADPKNTGRIPYVEFVEKMMGIVRKSPKKEKGKKGKKK